MRTARLPLFNRAETRHPDLAAQSRHKHGQMVNANHLTAGTVQCATISLIRN